MRWLPLLMILFGCNGGEIPSDRTSAPPPDASASTAESGPQTARAVSTDRDRYTFEEGAYGPELTIQTTFTAPDDQTVYVVNCNGQISTGLQSEQNGVWNDVWSGITDQCLSEPIVLSPGSSWDYDLIVRRGSGAGSGGTDDLPPPGRYRVVWRGTLSSFDANSYPFGDPLPEEQRTSEPIVID